MIPTDWLTLIDFSGLEHRFIEFYRVQQLRGFVLSSFIEFSGFEPRFIEFYRVQGLRSLVLSSFLEFSGFEPSDFEAPAPEISEISENPEGPEAYRNIE